MWIDRIVELRPRERLVAIKNVSLAEEHLHDHFPASGPRSALPVMPMSLIVEGMAQSAGILVGHAQEFREKVILAKVSLAELSREALPGQTLRYTATIQQMDRGGASTGGIVELLDHARPERGYERVGTIDLMFSHIDQNMAGVDFPEHNFVFSESFRTLLRTSGIEAGF
jgi:3-hydroxyacyl-[acyl-carrier-protein] dehydratase